MSVCVSIWLSSVRRSDNTTRKCKTSDCCCCRRWIDEIQLGLWLMARYKTLIHNTQYYEREKERQKEREWCVCVKAGIGIYLVYSSVSSIGNWWDGFLVSRSYNGEGGGKQQKKKSFLVLEISLWMSTRSNSSWPIVFSHVCKKRMNRRAMVLTWHWNYLKLGRLLDIGGVDDEMAVAKWSSCPWVHAGGNLPRTRTNL